MSSSPGNRSQSRLAGQEWPWQRSTGAQLSRTAAHILLQGWMNLVEEIPGWVSSVITETTQWFLCKVHNLCWHLTSFNNNIIPEAAAMQIMQAVCVWTELTIFSYGLKNVFMITWEKLQYEPDSIHCRCFSSKWIRIKFSCNKIKHYILWQHRSCPKAN